MAPVVLQLIDGDGDEVRQDVVDVATALTAESWRTAVATTGDDLWPDLARLRLPSLKLPGKPGRGLARWRTARMLARFIRRNEIGLVHARSVAAAQLAAPVARSHSVPLLTTVHDIHEATADAPVAASDRVIVVSERLAEELPARLGMAPERVRLVRRWVSLDRFDPAAVRGHQVVAVAERCGIPAGPRVVMVPSTIVTDGDLRLLTGMLPGLREPDILLMVTGALDPAAAAATALFRELAAVGWAERVRFCAGDDLPAALALADVVLLPATRGDPSTRLPAAAQAMGRPVVVTDVGALAEAVMPASTGWLVGTDDPGEAAQAIDLALAMPEDARERLATRARGFAAERFSAPAQIAREVAVYRELCPSG